MSICQPIASITFPAIALTESLNLQPRIFSLTTTLFTLSGFGFLLYRLIVGYRLALSGDYKEYTPELAEFTTGSSAANGRRQLRLNFPLVFPIYFKYLFALFFLLLCQLVLGLFAPNSPVEGPAIFFSSMTVYTMFHALEQGLLVFLCQRSIGSGAIRRSIIYATAWGVIVLSAVIIAANIDRQNSQNNSTAGGESGQNGDSDSGGNHTSSLTDILHHYSDKLHHSRRQAHAQPAHSFHSQYASDLSGSSDWRDGSWFDLSGSALVIDTATTDIHVTFLACLLCDAVLLVYYTGLFIIRIRCLRIMPWLSSRVSAFSLARFLFVRRLLSVVSMLLFLLTSYADIAYCLNISVQLYMLAYGLCMYLFVVWDSRFWRKLEYLANGPFPNYRSLDEEDSGGAGKSGSGNNDGSDGKASNDSPTNDSGAVPLSHSDSIAPLLKLPRTGLTNLDPIMSSYLVDFSELNIDTSSPLGIGQEDTAVYAATYRGQVVAVKRVRCDVLTIDLIEHQLNEARLMSEISHPNIVRFIGVCIRPPAICLVSELCENGSLFELIKKHRRRSNSSSGSISAGSESGSPSFHSPLTGSEHASYHTLRDNPSLSLATIVSFGLDAGSALSYLHSFTPPIVHHDIKSTNFVLDSDNRLKLIDFGESRRSKLRAEIKHRQGRAKGTIGWMAPELLSDIHPPSHLLTLLGEMRVNDKTPLTNNELLRILASVDVHDGADVELFNSDSNYNDEEEWIDVINNTYTRVLVLSNSIGGDAHPPSQSFSSRLSSSTSLGSLSFNSLSRSLFSSSPQSMPEKIDIYGLGILLWSMIDVKQFPFPRIPSFLVPFLVTHGVRPACPLTAPQLLIKLIRACWNPRPHHRPSAKQAVERLECIRFQVTGVVSDRLKMLASMGFESVLRPTTPATPAPPVAVTATVTATREGLYGQYYQRPKSRQTQSSTATSSASGNMSRSRSSLLFHSLPPRIATVSHSGGLPPLTAGLPPFVSQSFTASSSGVSAESPTPISRSQTPEHMAHTPSMHNQSHVSMSPIDSGTDESDGDTASERDSDIESDTDIDEEAARPP